MRRNKACAVRRQTDRAAIFGGRYSELVNGTMEISRLTQLRRVLTLLATVLILKVIVSVVLAYRDYFPPNFESDFLHGRQDYFYSAYQWAFYAHIITGPVSLLLGLILINERFRIQFAKWHRSLGKVQAALVLLLITPSGLWMARYAQTGSVAAIGFSVLAIATAACVLFGWRTAVMRRFVDHRRWMWRCFLLLCSAVVLRLVGGFVAVTGIGAAWSYPLAAWASWLVPLAIFELSDPLYRWMKRCRDLERGHSAPSIPSLPAIEIMARRTSAGTSKLRN
jgi:hypothetical protein